VVVPKVLLNQHTHRLYIAPPRPFRGGAIFVTVGIVSKGRVTKGRQDTTNPDPPASYVLADTSSAGTLLITPETGFERIFLMLARVVVSTSF